ncbi:hypothetical protein, partial [Candidatus Villigracilis proximus]|uniref:hypothetical protein n=1 Tax=Candidatus Villigracilis proximus TaxID=3140683 RepID=UPI0031E86DE7
PFFGTHIGPFMGTYMARGMEDMFRMFKKDMSFVQAVMEVRTDWCIVYKRAAELGSGVDRDGR